MECWMVKSEYSWFFMGNLNFFPLFHAPNKMNDNLFFCLEVGFRLWRSLYQAKLLSCLDWVWLKTVQGC